MDAKLRQLRVSLIVVSNFDAHNPSLIEAHIQNALFIAPIQTACLQGKRLLPNLLELVAINLTLIIFSYLKLECYHASNRGIHTARHRRRCIFLRLLPILLPWHCEL